MSFNFNPTDGLLNVNEFPTNPASETEARNQFMTLFNQVRDYLNGSLDATSLNGKKYDYFAKSDHNHDSSYIKQSDFSLNNGTDGYYKMPNGMIMQWGSVSNVANGSSKKVTFPKVFINTCFNVQLTGNYSGSQGYALNITALSKEGFTVHKWHVNGGSATDTIYYFAIGI